ncbi:calcium-binding protein, partial [Streptomyces albidoflavus]
MSGGDGDDTLTGMNGDDWFKGGANFDTVDYQRELGGTNNIGVYVNLSASAINAIWLGNYTVIQSYHAIDSFGANDEFNFDIEKVIGSNHHDVMTAAGNATQGFFFFGHDGDDVLTGSALADTLFGGKGVDYIKGGSGSDLIDGLGEIFTFEESADTLLGEMGDDTISGSATASIVGGEGNDRLIGGHIYYTDRTYDWIVDLSANQVLRADLGEMDTLQNVVAVTTGDGRDTLIAGSVGAFLDAGAGDDVLRGGAGGDNLIGGSGYDVFYGSGGNDTVDGGVAPGNSGGILDYSSSVGGINASFSTHIVVKANGTDIFQNITNLT